jgi:hypothetical protein
VTELSENLLLESDKSLQRLEAWLRNECSFSAPSAPDVPDPTFANFDSAYVPVVTEHFLNRACRLGRSVELLCRNAMAIEAQSILRVAVESAIDLRYISTNPVTLATKWMLFEDVVRLRGLQQDPPEERPEDYEFISDAVSERLRLLNTHRPHRSGKPWKISELGHDWDQSSLEARYNAAQTRLGDSGQEWYLMYRLLCAHVHGGTETFREFTKPHAGGQYVYSLMPPRSKQVFAATLSLLSLQEFLQSANHCGAKLDAGRMGPQFDALGVSRSELIDVASRDFDVNLVE